VGLGLSRSRAPVLGEWHLPVGGDCDVLGSGRYAGGENKNERAEAAGTSGSSDETENGKDDGHVLSAPPVPLTQI
jgi:hypothetical protein